MNRTLSHWLSIFTFVLFLAGEQMFAQADPSEGFFTNGVIPTLQIELDSATVNSLRAQSRVYVKAIVREGEEVYREVGIHLKGGFGTYQTIDEKPSFTLNFDKYVRGQRFHGLDKFHLNNSIQDQTFMTELICGELFRAAGVPAPRVSHARVTLNGRDLGLYVLVEGFDKTFLRRHFANPNGNCYDGERKDIIRPLKKTSGDGPDDHSDLQTLVEAAQAGSNGLTRLEKVLDLDRFHSFLALEALTCHWDGYAMSRNNYRLYHDPSQSRFVFMPHGMDQMFGRPWAPILPDSAGLVAQAVLGDPAGRRRHRERCALLASNLLSPERLTNRVNELRQRIRPVLAQIDPKRVRRHDEAVDKLRRQMAERATFLEERLKSTPLPVTFDAHGVAALSGWAPYLNGGEARLLETAGPTPSLVVSNVGMHIPFVASWRTQVLLPAGRYRFEGEAEVTGLTPVASAPNGGIGLRVFGYPNTLSTPLATQATMREVEQELNVATDQEVELICEVRAYQGVVQWSKDSLRLVRTSKLP